MLARASSGKEYFSLRYRDDAPIRLTKRQTSAALVQLGSPGVLRRQTCEAWPVRSDAG